MTNDISSPTIFPGFTEADIAHARQLLAERQTRKRTAQETRRQEALAAALEHIPPVMARYLSVQAAYLFGSVIRVGSFHAESDIDIGVMGLEPTEYTPLWLDLEAALPHWVIDLRELPPETSFTNLVIRFGRQIYEQ